MDKLLMMKYEEMLTGNFSNYPYEYFIYTGPVNQRLALDVIRYAVERILRWNPYELRDRLSWEILRKLKLDFFMKYLEFPVELNREKDLFYVAWLLYPKPSTSWILI